MIGSIKKHYRLIEKSQKVEEVNALTTFISRTS